MRQMRERQIMKLAGFESGAGRRARKGEKRMQRRNSTAAYLPALFIAVEHLVFEITPVHKETTHE